MTASKWHRVQGQQGVGRRVGRGVERGLFEYQRKRGGLMMANTQGRQKRRLLKRLREKRKERGRRRGKEKEKRKQLK